MKLFGFRFLLTVAFVGSLGLLASSPAMAYCRVCGPGGCYDVGQGQTGYTYCDRTNGYCRQSGWGCTGGSQCSSTVPGECIDHQSMMAPESTMVLAAGDRGMERFKVVELARLNEVAAESGVCLALGRPAASNDVVIR